MTKFFNLSQLLRTRIWTGASCTTTLPDRTQTPKPLGHRCQEKETVLSLISSPIANPISDIHFIFYPAISSRHVPEMTSQRTNGCFKFAFVRNDRLPFQPSIPTRWKPSLFTSPAVLPNWTSHIHLRPVGNELKHVAKQRWSDFHTILRLCVASPVSRLRR